MTTLTQRAARFAAPLLAVLPLILAPLPAAAQNQTAARAHVERVAGEVVRVLNAPGTLQAKQSDFRNILTTGTDVRGIAGFAVGRYGRAMNAAQRDEYVELFIEYTVKAYIQQFEERIGGANTYDREIVRVLRVMNAGRRGTYVQTTIDSGAPEPLSVEWLVRDRRGQALISDMIIEGVSLAQLTRDEFTEMLNRRGGNIPAFLDRLRSRIQEL